MKDLSTKSIKFLADWLVPVAIECVKKREREVKKRK